MNNNKENNPDNLGGLGDLLPAEVLKMLNEMLELLQQKGHPNQGSNVINIYAPGSQYVDTQINIGDACYKPRKAPQKDDASAKKPFNADTPLSTLFRESHHEGLRRIIDSWRPYLVDDDPAIDALALSSFQFDLEQIRPVCIYMDLARLINHDALSAPMSVLAAYLFKHSNLSCSENALYVQLKRYKKMCK